MQRGTGFYMGCVSAIALAFPGMALAQSAPAAAPAPQAGGQIQDILVTARRTSEALQTTPVAVTALNEEALETAQVQMVDDLQRTTPSLSVGLGGSGPSTVIFLSIRGQGQVSPNSTADPAVGTYVDGVYIARPVAGNLDLLDVQRAEVLRGPQGTLFGRNTTGGAINIISNPPTGEFEGSLKAELGNYDQRRLQGVVNFPLNGDELALRLVGGYDEHDGYGRFVRLNNRPAGDVRSNYLARATLRWAPEAVPLTLTIAGDYSRYRDSGDTATTLAVNPDFDLGGITVGQAFDAVGFDPTPYLSTKKNFYRNYGYNDTGEADLDTPFDAATAKGIAATVEVELGSATIKSITAYRKSRVGTTLDLDGLPINMVSFKSDYAQHQFSEELQVYGSAGDLDWIAGAYYFIEKGTERSDAKSFGFLNPAAPVARNTDGNIRSTSYALFGQLNYDFTDRLRATAGFRYTWDSRELVIHALTDRDDPDSCAVVRDVPGGPCDQTRKAKFKYPAWTAGLDYKINDALFVYAKTSGASMSGGWNIRDTFAPAFKPENVRDVEVGVKADLLDRRLRANAAFFYAWQSDVQRIINTFDPKFQALTQYVVNAGKAHIHGAEFELTALPWSGMEITGNLALLKGSYVDGSFVETQIVNGLPVLVDRSGERLPQLPKVTARIGATQTVPTSFGEASLHLDYSYISSRAFYQNTPADTLPQSVKDQYALANQFGIVKGYGLLNGRAAIKLDDPAVEIAVFARNLTNKRYLTNSADFLVSFGVAQGTVGDPRTYGVSVGYRW